MSAEFTAADRELMVREQIFARGVRDPRVLEALRAVPREQFMPAHMADAAYEDRALPIDCQQTISQPYIVALMSEALHLDGSETVLEIGTGSGYQAAVLSQLAHSVVSIERHEELSARAGEVLKELGCDNVRLVIGDGLRGWPEAAPYDAILVMAAAGQVPEMLLDQLADGGRLVIPVGPPESQVLREIRRSGDEYHSHSLCGCRFVPLVSD